MPRRNSASNHRYISLMPIGNNLLEFQAPENAQIKKMDPILVYASSKSDQKRKPVRIKYGVGKVDSISERIVTVSLPCNSLPKNTEFSAVLLNEEKAWLKNLNNHRKTLSVVSKLVALPLSDVLLSKESE